MPPKDNRSEIKSIIKDTINELLADEGFIAKVVKSVIKNLNLNELEETVKKCQQKIRVLETENNTIKTRITSLEQSIRNNNIRIYGIKEQRNENITEKVVEVIENKMSTNITINNIEKCYRVGDNKNNTNHPRAVFVQLKGINHKEAIIKNRKLLKNTGITIVEDLCQENYHLFKQAANILGKRNVWTSNGKIYAIINNSKKKISTTEDITRWTSTTENETEED